MVREVTRKLHNRKAFSFAEMLFAMLIMLMVSAIMAEGIPVARNAYERVVLVSNAEVLLSTTVSMLRNELGTANTVDIPEGTSVSNGKKGTAITYYNPIREAQSKIYMDDGKDIKFVRYSSAAGLSNQAGAPEKFVSSETATNNLSVTFEYVLYNPNSGIVTFQNLRVMHGNKELANRNVSIRVISEGKQS